MRELTGDRLRELGERFGVAVDGDETYLIEQANANLDGLEAVYEVPVEGFDGAGDRSWCEPTDDPYNALVVECSVPPIEGHTGLLDGVSVGVKDIVAVAGVPMECGSASMRGLVPSVDATVVRRLREAGAAIAAKTNLDEFAGGARGWGFRGQMRNPHDEERVPGGSSGGSAIAVATGLVDVALGTDTGGSIRGPASHLGIVGLKPTYGLVPISGIVENTYTFDHVGPMTPTVEAAARVLEATAGKDPDDPASLQAAGRDGYRVGGYVDAVGSPPDPADLAVGVVEEGLGGGAAEQEVADPVVDRTEAAIDRLEDAGAAVERLSIERFEHCGPVKYVTSYCELAAHWRDGGAPYRRGGAVDERYQNAFASRARAASGDVNPYYRARLLAGAQLIDGHRGRHYARALAARETLRGEFEEALAGVDALCYPTFPTLPPRIEEVDRPGFAYSRNLNPANVTRMPAITLPNGRVDDVPVGLQLVADAFDETTLLGAAAAVESALG